MLRSDFRFLDRLRVRWAEIDAQKIVFNGHYLMYFDTAVAGYWRAMGLSYAETMQALDGDLFVRKAELEYRASARYDDVLDVGMRCARIGTSSVVFEGAVFRREEPLVGGSLVYVFAELDGSRSKPVPPALREAFERFESGQPMVEVELGDWSRLGGEARALREAVFMTEQRIPADLEWDGDDASALHAVARDRLGRALATGRLTAPSPGIARIGRMAVTATLRNAGVGRRVLETLLAAARDRGDREAMLHAQRGAVPFYERAGFRSVGPPFDEAGIEHVEMRRALSND